MKNMLTIPAENIYLMGFFIALFKRIPTFRPGTIENHQPLYKKHLAASWQIIKQGVENENN
jgi:hypothetical protein